MLKENRKLNYLYLIIPIFISDRLIAFFGNSSLFRSVQNNLPIIQVLQTLLLNVAFYILAINDDIIKRKLRNFYILLLSIIVSVISSLSCNIFIYINEINHLSIYIFSYIICISSLILGLWITNQRTKFSILFNEVFYSNLFWITISTVFIGFIIYLISNTIFHSFAIDSLKVYFDNFAEIIKVFYLSIIGIMIFIIWLPFLMLIYFNSAFRKRFISLFYFIKNYDESVN